MPSICTNRFFAWTTCAAVVIFAFLLDIDGQAYSQQNNKPSTEKWRPRDGVYASPGKDFERDCDEAGYIVVDLAEKTVGGNEWNCQVTKLTGATPGTIKLNLTCDDLNLAVSLKMPEEAQFKEIMFLDKIDESGISIRKTLNGKFRGLPWKANYCPEQAQRRYVDGKAEAAQKAAEEKIRRNPWRPSVGVYAAAGADFSERCSNGGETIIDLGERLVSSGDDKCKVVQIRDEVNSLQMFVDCNTPPRPETIILRKLDDKTVLLQKTKNRNFSDAGEQLSYCGPATQTMYAQQKGKK